MNNYEYVIASLPELFRDGKENADFSQLLDEIRSQLGRKDNASLSLLLDGFVPEKLDLAFYNEAEKSSNAFIRSFFSFDRRLRNEKVRFINRALGRPEFQDVLLFEDEVMDTDPELSAIFETDDLLAREKGIDDAVWKFVDDYNALNVFGPDAVLGFVVKLKIVERWMKLDPESGKLLLERILKLKFRMCETTIF